MKYGYRFMDWGLFDIDEIYEVSEMQEDYHYKDALANCTFSKERYAWVKCNKPIFLRARAENGKLKFTEEFEGPFPKEHIFDTKEEAEKYGRENSSCNFF